MADANAVEAFLKDKFPVDLYITNLRDNDATQSRIREELQAMPLDPRIWVGDTMIIYYAGHGGVITLPPVDDIGFTSVAMIQPWDYRPAAPGETQSGITHLELEVLLTKLANAKGDNIVSFRSHKYRIRSLISLSRLLCSIAAMPALAHGMERNFR